MTAHDEKHVGIRYCFKHFLLALNLNDIQYQILPFRFIKPKKRKKMYIGTKDDYNICPNIQTLTVYCQKMAQKEAFYSMK